MKRYGWLIVCGSLARLTLPAVEQKPYSLELLGEKVQSSLLTSGTILPASNAPAGKTAFEVRGQQCGFRVPGPAFVGPHTSVRWAWQKTSGHVCILQVGMVNPETGEHRYLGYGAGSLSEPPSADPTVEVFLSDKIPLAWTTCERDLAADIQSVLGWSTAEINEVYLSPWDGSPGCFADVALHDLYATDVAGQGKRDELAFFSSIGKGHYVAPRLKKNGEMRQLKHDTSFEELAPGRNSAANEWTAYGAPGDNAFNCMGRDLRVRYPLYDLVFRLAAGDTELKPDQLESFRLGLVNNRLPAIRASWEYEGLRYRVSVMAVPTGADAAFDLYKLEVENPASQPLESRLLAGLDGPSDMRLDAGVVRGIGASPFMIVDAPQGTHLTAREWGLCDKRAKSYGCGAGPGQVEEAVSSTRIGMDGVPVVYRVKAPAGQNLKVCLVASQHINHLLAQPKQAGDLIFEYQVEGCPPQRLDWFEYIRQKNQPLCLEFNGGHDTDGDGFIQVVAGVAPNSRMRHTRLSAIYVFAEGTRIDNPADIYSGSLNGRCLRHIDVGITPECGVYNQEYDTSDVGLCRLDLAYGGTVAAGQSKTFWLKVPTIHRRQPVSMGSYSHAFLKVLPGEGVPEFGGEQLQALRQAKPEDSWRRVIEYRDHFSQRLAAFDTPDPVLRDVYLSRLATRAVLDVRISDAVWFNACSPYFYYDFAYRDQAYVVYAYDLAGLHDLAGRLLQVYCTDIKDVPKGPIAFGETPLQLGMADNGLWLTRPGQYDAQGQNLWCLVEHYKLSGDRAWLEGTAYPYIRRGAQWIVDSRHRHMQEVKNPDDPRYGLIEPGAMEVATMTKGMHHYYMDAWAVLGLREAADAAQALGREEEARTFSREAEELQACLGRSFRSTFKRVGLYEGYLWFGVEKEGEGMYGFWGHTPLVWPTRAIAAQDPMVTGTFRAMERMADQWGGAMHSDGAGGCWPYIGVDWAISYILRGEPDRTLDYFCAFTDTAGSTFSWGEGYENKRNFSAGDQPHFWADAQWVNLYRHLFVFEDGGTLMLTPATLRCWQEGATSLHLRNVPTHFGNLELTVTPQDGGKSIDYRFRLTPQGDQAKRRLEKVAVDARTPQGRSVAAVLLDDKPWDYFVGEKAVIPRPEPMKEYRLRFLLQ